MDSRITQHIIILILGLILDLIFGDPVWMYHPVQAIGLLISSMEKITRKIFPDTKKGRFLAGMLTSVVTIAVTTILPVILLFAVYKINVWFGIVVESVLVYFMLAVKSLRKHSEAVVIALKSGETESNEDKALDEARKAVSRIVGRDTDKLSREGIIKATVETVAENTSDGIIAPLLYAAVGGAAFMYMYKAVNTLDSMIGYKNEKYEDFGCFAARLDDVFNFVPARIAAFFMIIASFSNEGFDGKNAFKTYIRDRKKHSSPNSAQTESVMAGALGVELGGNAYYFGKLCEKPTLGEKINEIKTDDILKACRLMLETTLLCLFICISVLYSLDVYVINKNNISDDIEKNISSDTDGEALELSFSITEAPVNKYAEGFKIMRYSNGCSRVEIKADKNYLFIPESFDKKKIIKAYPECTVIKKKQSSIYLAASAVMSLFEALDSVDRISFSSLDESDWYIEAARNAMKKGEILYAGKYSQPDYELLLSKGCELAIESTMIQHSPQVAEKLKELGIPVLVDYSSYEKDPRGRLEWIKVYGELCGKEEEADRYYENQLKLFEASVSSANDGNEEGGSYSKQTVAFFYISESGTAVVRKPWDYVPRMIELSGGEYFLKTSDFNENENASSSFNMTMEDFYVKAKDCDILVYNATIKNPVKDMQALLDKSPALKDFKAVKNNRVYCCSKSMYQDTAALGDITNSFREMLAGRDSEYFKNIN